VPRNNEVWVGSVNNSMWRAILLHAVEKAFSYVHAIRSGPRSNRDSSIIVKVPDKACGMIRGPNVLKAVQIQLINNPHPG